MVFVPFTVLDNHKRCVFLGAALLGNETAESYIWLLEHFLLAFGKEPQIVVTDQCLSICKVVTTVFKKSVHRLCMWHITKKINDKVIQLFL